MLNNNLINNQNYVIKHDFSGGIYDSNYKGSRGNMAKNGSIKEYINNHRNLYSPIMFNILSLIQPIFGWEMYELYIDYGKFWNIESVYLNNIEGILGKNDYLEMKFTYGLYNTDLKLGIDYKIFLIKNIDDNNIAYIFTKNYIYKVKYLDIYIDNINKNYA